MTSMRILSAAILGLGLFAATGAGAQPVSSASSPSIGSGIAQVDYRDRYDRDGGSVLDIPGDVVEGATDTAGAVVNDALGDGDSGEAACARRFRSFDPETGTYTAYSGQQVMCPYLRG